MIEFGLFYHIANYIICIIFFCPFCVTNSLNLPILAQSVTHDWICFGPDHTQDPICVYCPPANKDCSRIEPNNKAYNKLLLDRSHYT